MNTLPRVAAGLAGLLTSLIVLANNDSNIRDVRMGDWNDRVRLVVEAEHFVNARMHQRGRQIRLELPGVNLASLEHRLALEPPQRHINIRAHTLDVSTPGRPVLVLNLTYPHQAFMFTLQSNEEHAHRVVLDLKPGSGDPTAALRPEPAGRVQLRAVRIGEWSDRIRIVVETTRPLAFEVRGRQQGTQIEVQLDGLGAAALAPAVEQAMADNPGLAASAHVNGGAPDRARLRLKLQHPARATLFNLAPDGGFGHRLVMDLIEQTAQVPERGAAAEQEISPLPEPDRSESGDGDGEWLWLDATLNRQSGRQTVLALDTPGGLHLTREDLAYWQLQLPAHAHLERNGEALYSLRKLMIEYEYDWRRLTLDMTAPPRLFSRRNLETPGSDRPEPSLPTPGVFFNYDLSTTRSSGDTHTGSLVELGVFGRQGTATTSVIWRNGSDRPGRNFVRLDTAWRRDDPGHRRSLIVGDTITRGPAWSGGVRFAGLQWGNNFELDPELVTLPLLSMSGEARLPSTAEVYVNGALRLRQDVAPGPFDIDRLPIVTGSGQARLVVTDILGRQQVITRDFYASRRLLRRGLHDWSWEFGAVRENYGLDSFDYGRAMAAATHRYGFANHFTGEAHVQLTESHGTAGIGGNWLLPIGGVVSATTALSRGDQANGWYAALGLQKQGRRFSGGIEARLASRDFTRLGLTGGRGMPRYEQHAFLNMREVADGTLGLSYTARHYHDARDVRMLSLRYSRPLPVLGHLSLSAVHYLAEGDSAVTVNLSIPLGQSRTTASTSVNWSNDDAHARFGLRRSLPVGSGLGYELHSRVGDGSSQRGSLSWQHDYGRWHGEVAHRDGNLSVRAQVAGGLVLMDGELKASRKLDESFALIRVPGFADVRVYADNQVIGRTDDQGRLLVPRLRPYQRNRLRIEQADLPLAATVDGLETVLTPYWRSGVVATFPVRRSRNAVFRIELENGDPAPVGAIVHDENGETWPVGRRGEAFMTDLTRRNVLQLRHHGRLCRIELHVPDSEEPLPDLGTVICHEVDP